MGSYPDQGYLLWALDLEPDDQKVGLDVALPIAQVFPLQFMWAHLCGNSINSLFPENIQELHYRPNVLGAFFLDLLEVLLELGRKIEIIHRSHR